MEYKINVGDKFLCLKDFVMDDGEVAYVVGVVYTSELPNCITDSEGECYHFMNNIEDFFEHFKPLQKVALILDEWSSN